MESYRNLKNIWNLNQALRVWKSRHLSEVVRTTRASGGTIRAVLIFLQEASWWKRKRSSFSRKSSAAAKKSNNNNNNNKYRNTVVFSTKLEWGETRGDEVDDWVGVTKSNTPPQDGAATGMPTPYPPTHPRASERSLSSRVQAPCHRILRWHGAVTHHKMYFAMNVSDDSPTGEEHDVQSHMFRPTITDMQDKYCGTCYDIYLIQSQYHKRGGAAFGPATSFVVSFVLALDTVNKYRSNYHNTCLACRYLWVWTCVIRHHVPRHSVRDRKHWPQITVNPHTVGNTARWFIPASLCRVAVYAFAESKTCAMRAWVIASGTIQYRAKCVGLSQKCPQCLKMCWLCSREAHHFVFSDWSWNSME